MGSENRDDRMIRVIAVPVHKDKFLSRTGDKIEMDIPGGRVTFSLNGGWSASGIAYCRLSYEPMRSGLIQFGAGPGGAA